MGLAVGGWLPQQYGHGTRSPDAAVWVVSEFAVVVTAGAVAVGAVEGEGGISVGPSASIASTAFAVGALLVVVADVEGGDVGDFVEGALVGGAVVGAIVAVDGAADTTSGTSVGPSASIGSDGSLPSSASIWCRVCLFVCVVFVCLCRVFFVFEHKNSRC
jgi:hypothetical protein